MHQKLHRALALLGSEMWIQIAPPELRASTSPLPQQANSSSSLTSVPQDALDAVLGPPLVVLQLLLLDLVLIFLLVASAPELASHDAADGADCKQGKQLFTRFKTKK